MNNFATRHIGPRDHEVTQMLKEIGVSSLEELIRETIPSDIRLKTPIELEPAISEHDYLQKIKTLAAKNKLYRNFIGMGYYGTSTPAVILRNIFENPSWYTSYTPYQAEVSQGRLEALINFQTMVSSLTALPIANCSLLDESTAAGEAMRMMYELRSREAVKAGRNVIFVDENVFPQTKDVILTRSSPLNIKVEFGKAENCSFQENLYGIIVQYPGANGEIKDYSALCTQAHEKGILVTAIADILSLTLLTPPGEWGADISVGSTQRFGIPLGFGGPSAGYMSCKEAFKRHIPGRIIGVSVDRLGRKSFRMALQTREQHIKREKATSNICTAQALLATMAGMFAVYHGPEGIKAIATNAHKKASSLAKGLEQLGYKLRSNNFFDTIEVLDVPVEEIRKEALKLEINLFYLDNSTVRISCDELSSCRDVKDILSVFARGKSFDNCCSKEVEYVFDPKYLRKSEFLTENIFNYYRSETEMMRYIKKLERRDVSLTHSMISLGSCTMKLNAAAEMLPLSWPELANIHPLVPKDQAEGYYEMITDLEKDIARITGFDAVSFQPNSGASGEYAGMLVIREYLLSRGEGHRDIVIIPASAHGTNPATAAMAGMKIVVTPCDENGNISMPELRTNIETHKENLCGIMITYPSTHGVFEEGVREIMDLIHNAGGQVFMDGANMNAQVALTNPGFIGADVCHLNLHKTFAIPHGGGGPGEGPICVAKHLTPFLPSHPLVKTGGEKGIKAVSSSPFGSALILAITYGYVKMLGEVGLKQATSLAILNANYLSKKLSPYYATLYTGKQGRVGHECILDLRNFGKEYGVDATDVAKRLMDYGFHAPTLSFPVANTLMVEPTESESLQELDRFVETMISIKKECEDIVSGKLDKEDNPLKMAPHMMEEVTANEWKHNYSRQQAAFPLEWIAENKFWPASARVDNGYGDRNLVCSCDPIEDYIK